MNILIIGAGDVGLRLGHRLAREKHDITIVEALRSRGVEVEYIVKDDEGHGFQKEENRFEFYRALEEFLGRQLA